MKKENLDYRRICEVEKYFYSIREDGAVIRTSKARYTEKRIKPFLVGRCAYVAIQGERFSLKALVAKHFIKGWKPGSHIANIDGDPMNCARWNLELLERHRRTNWSHPASVRVAVEGAEFASINQAANALFVSPKTLSDFLKGRHRKTVLDGKDIARAN